MGRHFDHIGRALSLLIFIAGIGLLIVVFVVAYHMLTNPVPGLSAALAAKAGANPQQPLMGISSAVLTFLLRLAVLFVMTIAASLIAARGIHLYFGAVGATGSQSANAGASASGKPAAGEEPVRRDSGEGASPDDASSSRQ